MAGRRGGGGGPWRELLSMVVALIMLGVLMVGLVSSGGWRVLSERLGIGDPNASTGALTESKGDGPGRNPDAVDITKLLAGLKPSGAAAGQTGSQTTAPQTGADGAGQAGGTAGGQTAPADPDASAPAAAPSSGVEYWRASLKAIDSIGTARANPAGYNREDEFGGWAANGCGEATTRDAILARDLKDARTDRACRVVSGTLTDPYTGRTIAFKRGVDTSSAIQIDHVVSLYDAWASGASKWSREQRVAYANDPDVLLASDGPANMAKGSGIDLNGTSQWLSQHTGAPDIWMPDNKAYRCDYMARRAAIKAKYKLTMTARERQQTVTFLASCTAGR
ncbi:HNH endonuclease family protein [Bifidobacterium myosotis]|uniref:HNH endonuclease n=1 Tax=Bifidobacterium myosotis TaxID=1630166 RepID=A0A5M9ZHH7_9BIFI|nr:HNH endonuclease family protein [Bifidobacterium myosotis]KAA8826909.1 HNH endonuclease [Bifidobacterium myosotis]